MNYLDEIAKIDQEIDDMNTAKSRAKEAGLKLGDYDLTIATFAAAEDRRIRQEIEENNIT